MAASGNPLAPNPETNIDNPGFPNPPIPPEKPQENLSKGVPIGETDEDSGDNTTDDISPDDIRHEKTYAYYGPM